MPLDPEQVTIVSILVGIGAAGVAKKWVFGWAFTDMEKDRNFWRDTALRSMGHTDKAIEIAKQSAPDGP